MVKLERLKMMMVMYLMNGRKKERGEKKEAARN